MWFTVALVKFHWFGINWHVCIQSEYRNCCLYVIRKSRHRQNQENISKYGFSPDLGGKNGGVLSMRVQVILDSSFARPGSVPIWGGKKGEFRDWTKWWIDRQQVRSIDRNLFFSKIKLCFLRRWWQLWMKSTQIKLRYQVNFFFSLCFACQLYCWTRWVNWFTIDVHLGLLFKLYGYIVCKTKRTIASLPLCFNLLFSVVQFWNYTKTIIRLRLSEYCRMIPSNSSWGLFDNIHFGE